MIMLFSILSRGKMPVSQNAGFTVRRPKPRMDLLSNPGLFTSGVFSLPGLSLPGLSLPGLSLPGQIHIDFRVFSISDVSFPVLVVKFTSILEFFLFPMCLFRSSWSKTHRFSGFLVFRCAFSAPRGLKHIDFEVFPFSDVFLT